MVFLFLLFRTRVPRSRIRDRYLLFCWVDGNVLLLELLLETNVETRVWQLLGWEWGMLLWRGRDMLLGGRWGMLLYLRGGILLDLLRRDNSGSPGVDWSGHPWPWHGPRVGELRPLSAHLLLVENAPKLCRHRLRLLRGRLLLLWHRLRQLRGRLLLLWWGGWFNLLVYDGASNRRQIPEAGVAPSAFRLHGGGRCAPSGIVNRWRRDSRGRSWNLLTI